MSSIMLPAFSSQMQILAGHAESFVLLQKGNIFFLRQLSKQNEVIQTMGGECYIKDDLVVIIL